MGEKITKRNVENVRSEICNTRLAFYRCFNLKTYQNDFYQFTYINKYIFLFMRKIADQKQLTSKDDICIEFINMLH